MKVCLMVSTWKLSDDDPTAVAPIVESVRQLVKRGVEVHVFAPSYEGLRSHTVDGVPVYRFRYFFKRWENLTHKQGAPNRIRNPVYLVVAFFYILCGLFHAIWFCRKHRFDVIHVHWPFPHGIWGYAASCASGSPVLLTFHGAELLLCSKYFFVKYFLRHAIKHAGAMTANSTFTANQVAQLADRPADVVPYACAVQARPVSKNANKPVRELLFVGRLIARKGLDYLLRSLPLLDGRCAVHLHIIGDGDRAADWKALASELKLDGRVTFHGPAPNEELQRRYAEADIFILPAIVDDRGDTEGLGVVLVEALCFQTPVIASNVGGIPDVIIHERTGLLVPQKDSPALAQAIEQLLSDRALAQSLAEQGLDHATHYFDWERITQLWLKLYARVVADRGSKNALQSRPSIPSAQFANGVPGQPRPLQRGYSEPGAADSRTRLNGSLTKPETATVFGYLSRRNALS
jgi:glycosyltransferase involved in cell wall biosynthesis